MGRRCCVDAAARLARVTATHHRTSPNGRAAVDLQAGVEPTVTWRSCCA